MQHGVEAHAEVARRVEHGGYGVDEYPEVVRRFRQRDEVLDVDLDDSGHGLGDARVAVFLRREHDPFAAANKRID